MNFPTYKVAVVFSISSKFGSELRSGFELTQFALKAGFNILIMSDVEKNDEESVLESKLEGMNIFRIPSPIKKLKYLYKFTDFLPQIIWHYRVAKFIKEEFPNVELIWIINGAQPWLPIHMYLRKNIRLIWGPIGGGERCPEALKIKLSFFARSREKLRDFIQNFAIKNKAKLILSYPPGTIIPLARTRSASQLLTAALGVKIPIDIVPEILHPIRQKNYVFNSTPRHPKFVWAGQDIPRKNLELAINIFTMLKCKYFPAATLDIYGVESDKKIMGVNFCGWVNPIDWTKYCGNGILFITSFREGMPSVLLEAIQAGLLCISTDVGSVGEIDCETLMTIPMTNYPNCSAVMLEEIYKKIFNYLNKEAFCLILVMRIGLSMRYPAMEFLLQ